MPLPPPSLYYVILHGPYMTVSPHPSSLQDVAPPSHTTMPLLNILIWLFFELLHLLGVTIFDSPVCIPCVSQNDKQGSRMGWLEKMMFCAGYLWPFFPPKQKLARSDRMHFVDKSWLTTAELPPHKDFSNLFSHQQWESLPFFSMVICIGDYLLYLVQSYVITSSSLLEFTLPWLLVTFNIFFLFLFCWPFFSVSILLVHIFAIFAFWSDFKRSLIGVLSC